MKETQKPRYVAVPFGDAKRIEDGEALLLADAEAVSQVHDAAAGHQRSCRWVRRGLRAALLALAAVAVLHLVFCGMRHSHKEGFSSSLNWNPHGHEHHQVGPPPPFPSGLPPLRPSSDSSSDDSSDDESWFSKVKKWFESSDDSSDDSSSSSSGSSKSSSGSESKDDSSDSDDHNSRDSAPDIREFI